VDLLGRVEGDLATLRRSGALDAALRRWKIGHQALLSLDDAEALIGFLRDPDVEPRWAKDSVLAALCMEATHGDQSAAALLLWLMFPGLLRVRRRLAAWNALGREDLDAELLAGVWEAATAIGPTTASVAARLINRARRRAQAAIRQAADWTGRSEPISTQMGESLPEVGPGGLEDVLAEAVRAGAISEEEAELFRASRRTIGEVRARLGVTAYGAQNRRRRAKRRLLAWLANSSLIPPDSSPLGLLKNSPLESAAPPTRNDHPKGLCRGAGVAGRAIRGARGARTRGGDPLGASPRDPVQHKAGSDAPERG
jgi:hypothetical protein